MLELFSENQQKVHFVNTLLVVLIGAIAFFFFIGICALIIGRMVYKRSPEYKKKIAEKKEHKEVSPPPSVPITVPVVPPDEGTSKKKKGKNWFKWAFNWVVFLTIWGALAAIIVMAGIGVHKYVYVPFRQDMHRGLMEAQSGPTAIAHSWPNQVAVFKDRWSDPIASSTQGPIEWQLLEKNIFLDVLVNEQDIYRMYPIEDARWAPLQVTNVMTLRFRSVPIKGNRLWPPEKIFVGWKQH